MTIRKTITIDDELYELLQKLRAKMIEQGKDMSFAGTVNVVVMSGLVGSPRFNEKIWDEIAEFFEHDTFNDDIEKVINTYTFDLLRKLKKLKETHKL